MFKDYKKTFYIGIIVIALGITLTTTFSEETGSLGIVMIAIGGLLFIAAMSKKKKQKDKED
ncbi:MAG: hypothetical protein C0596_04160 [Marinilabiliales bacterium]|nr:MAG: hypothetical protein C0596_04160 [Marinilabiliales bacterium]